MKLGLRDVVTPARVRDVAGVAGLAAIAFGFHEAWRPLGWIVGGLELVGVALLTARGVAAQRAAAAEVKPPG